MIVVLYSVLLWGALVGALLFDRRRYPRAHGDSILRELMDDRAALSIGAVVATVLLACGLIGSGLAEGLTWLVPELLIGAAVALGIHHVRFRGTPMRK